MKLRPLHDRVIVKRLESETKTASGIVLMKTNLGLSDRAIRLFVGLTLLGLGTALDTPWGLLGLIPMLTAGLGFCPLYPLLGINTCEDSH